MELDSSWLERRTLTDLDPRAERAIRAAGLCFSDTLRSERHLQEAEALAPGHLAVLIARYKFCLYKHRFADAVVLAEACVAALGTPLGLSHDPHAVSAQQLDLGGREAETRAWLFAVQALGYVMMRAGETERGLAMLDHVIAIDPLDQSRTRGLRAVIAKAGQPDDD
jgi:hypothetical protein